MKRGHTMRTNANKLKRALNTLDKKDVIEFTTILYRKYFLDEEDINYTKLPDKVVALLGLTIGISYDNMHPTDESKKDESYKDWIYKMAKTSLTIW